MISLRKCLFSLCFGIGISVSLSAWALPGCSACLSMGNACVAGDQRACMTYGNDDCSETLAECGIPDPLDQIP